MSASHEVIGTGSTDYVYVCPVKGTYITHFDDYYFLLIAENKRIIQYLISKQIYDLLLKILSEKCIKISIDELENNKMIKLLLNEGLVQISTTPIVKWKLSYPPCVDWYVTFDCNFNCIYCKVRDREIYYNESIRKEANHHRAKHLEIAKKLVDIGVSFVTIDGGEPGLLNDIPEILRQLVEHVNHIEINTNGTFVIRHIEFLKSIDRSYGEKLTVAISLDGLQKINDLTRGKTNIALRAIEELVKHTDNISVAVRTTYTPMHSYEYLDELGNYLKAMKIDEWQVWFMLPQGRGYNVYKDLIGDVDKLENYLYNFQKDVDNISDDNLVPIRTPFRYIKQKEDESLKNRMVNLHTLTLFSIYNINCIRDGIHYSLDILPNGASYLCIDYGAESYIGNILELNPIDLIDKTQSIVKKIIKNPQNCKKCELYDFCGGGCPALRKAFFKLYGNFCDYTSRFLSKFITK